MKKIIISLISLLFICGTGFCQKITSDAILGCWLTSKGECKVEIYKKNNLYYGKIIWLKEPNDDKGLPVKDKENPDSKLKERNVIGITFMFDFQYDGEDKWTNGRIYNVDNGKTYQALVKMESNDVIYLRGYIGIPALGTDTRWTRVK